MKKQISYACLVLVKLITLPVVAADLQIGTPKVRITPPLGTPMAGYYIILYARCRGCA